MYYGDSIRLLDCILPNIQARKAVKMVIDVYIVPALYVYEMNILDWVAGKNKDFLDLRI